MIGNKLKLIVVILFGLLAIVAVLLTARPGSLAGLLGGGFGGRIIGIPIPCIDEGGYLIIVGSPAGGSFYISPFTTRIYKNYNPATPGVWVLGKATPFAYMPCSDAGVPLGYGLYVEKIGTGLLPF